MKTPSPEWRSMFTDAKDRHPEVFKTYRMRNGEEARLRVIEDANFYVVLQCISQGPQHGYRMQADTRRFKIWGAEYADIEKIAIGTELTVRAVPTRNDRAFMVGEIIEWKHV